ncbi:hypothetical protein FACS1894103_7250 [Campylobacterota bacterium]|nr:hypothetical protein FACS1894103_7250 [Campylobacterota bacterium]
MPQLADHIYSHTQKAQIISAATSVLRRYGIVRQAAFFGSAARDDFSDNSDIDILVDIDYEYKHNAWDFGGLFLDLKDALGRPIDVITYDALVEAKEQFRTSVEKDKDVFYER